MKPKIKSDRLHQAQTHDSRIGYLKSILNWLLDLKKNETSDSNGSGVASSSSPNEIDVEAVGFPLVPDDYHLRDVGRTAQGNGFWITQQLAVEAGGTRDFIVAYLFDKQGNLISSEVVDMGMRPKSSEPSALAVIEGLKRKIDARETAEIWVKPFSTKFYGHTFGLIVRESDEFDAAAGETVIDAMPGSTLMFYGPWTRCNYDS